MGGGVRPLLDAAGLLALQRHTAGLAVASYVRDYAVRLALRPGRPGQRADPGAPLRALWRQPASLAGAGGGRPRTCAAGRFNVGFGDVRRVAPAVLRHRLRLNVEADVRAVDPESVVAAVSPPVPEARPRRFALGGGLGGRGMTWLLGRGRRRPASRDGPATSNRSTDGRGGGLLARAAARLRPSLGIRSAAAPARSPPTRSSCAGWNELALALQRVPTAGLAGDHRSRRKNDAPEFADYRTYTPGDDFRRIDWKAYGRLGALYYRLGESQEDVALHLLVETSGSMEYGSPVKLDYARQLAAALGYLALARLDAVGAGRCAAHRAAAAAAREEPGRKAVHLSRRTGLLGRRG